MPRCESAERLACQAREAAAYPNRYRRWISCSSGKAPTIRSASLMSDSTPSSRPTHISAVACSSNSRGLRRFAPSGNTSSQPSRVRTSPREPHLPDHTLDEFRRPLVVFRCQRVLHRLRDQAVLLVPRRRPTVQLFDALEALALKPGSQEIGEEVVVAVPAPLVVQRNDEEVVPVQPLQLLLPVGASGERVTQRTTEVIENRGSK